MEARAGAVGWPALELGLRAGIRVLTIPASRLATEFLGRADRGGPYDLAFCDPPFAEVDVLSATLAHPGLAGALTADGLVVARILRKHPAALPPTATLQRTKVIGEEALIFLRYNIG